MYSSAVIPQRALKALENLLRVSKRLAMATLLGMGLWGVVGWDASYAVYMCFTLDAYPKLFVLPWDNYTKQARGEQ